MVTYSSFPGPSPPYWPGLLQPGVTPSDPAKLLQMGRRSVSGERRLKIGVVGFGKFGQFISKTFVKNHDVFAMGRGDYTLPARDIGEPTSRSWGKVP